MNIYTNPNTNYLNRKIVFVASDVTDDIVSGATLAIVTESSWHIFGRKMAHSFDKFSFPLPAGLKCPVVDISPVPDRMDERSKTLVLACKSGAITTAALMIGLIELGAKVVEKRS